MKGDSQSQPDVTNERTREPVVNAVTRSRGGQHPGTDIASSVESVLQSAIFLPINALKVMVEKGWITLSGSMDSNFHLEEANLLQHEIARNSAGNAAAVRNVNENRAASDSRSKPETRKIPALFDH